MCEGGLNLALDSISGVRCKKNPVLRKSALNNGGVSYTILMKMRSNPRTPDDFDVYYAKIWPPGAKLYNNDVIHFLSSIPYHFTFRNWTFINQDVIIKTAGGGSNLM